MTEHEMPHRLLVERIDELSEMIRYLHQVCNCGETDNVDLMAFCLYERLDAEMHLSGDPR